MSYDEDYRRQQARDEQRREEQRRQQVRDEQLREEQRVEEQRRDANCQEDRRQDWIKEAIRQQNQEEQRLGRIHEEAIKEDQRREKLGERRATWWFPKESNQSPAPPLSLFLKPPIAEPNQSLPSILSPFLKALVAKPILFRDPEAVETVGQVWVNTKSGRYWKPGSHYYRKTKQGKYMPEDEAIQKGYQLSNST